MFRIWLDTCLSHGDPFNVSDTFSPVADSPKQPLSSSAIDPVASRLRQRARLHFEGLAEKGATGQTSSQSPTPPSPTSSTSQSSPTTIAEDISNASTSTQNGALALLLSTLGEALFPGSDLEKNGTVSNGSNTKGHAKNRRRERVAKIRAINCITGALEGSFSLTQGVRQAVGQFLVELCRSVSIGDASDYYCEDNEEKMAECTSFYVDGSNLSPEQATKQLQAMENAHQELITPNSSLEVLPDCTDDDLRDAAIVSLSALLSSRLDIFPTQQSQSTSKNLTSTQHGVYDSNISEALGVIYQSMELRMELAVKGLRYRCALNDMEESNTNNTLNAGDGYGQTNNVDMHIEDGLSHLSRVKRSMCFNLLEGALKGLKEDEIQCAGLKSRLSTTTSASKSTIPPSLLKSMSTFACFSSSCLHGETDPRCLLQLLRLLNKIQQVMLHLFESTIFNNRQNKDSNRDANSVAMNASAGVNSASSQASFFPSVEMFDSVAPYYPVHFTPPKNDPHGITRDLLQDALMAVLCERDVVYDAIPLKNTNSEEEEHESMITLAARMFLERLEPPKSSMDEHDPPGSGGENDEEDKLEALRDLSKLFFTQSSLAKNETLFRPDIEASKNLFQSSPRLLSEMSSILARVHEESVSAPPKTSNIDNSSSENLLSLASAARQFASSVAYVLDPKTNRIISAARDINIPDTSRLWESFVFDLIRRLSPSLGTAPQGMHGRASTAFLASVAAGGGISTLNIVLEGCLPRFLSVLSLVGSSNSEYSASKNDGTDVSYSEFSSKKNRDEEKISAVLRGIAAFVSSCRVALEKMDNQNCGIQVHPHPLSPYLSPVIQILSKVLDASEEKSRSLSIAAVGTLESLLMCADVNELNGQNETLLEKIFSVVADVVLRGAGENAVNDDCDHDTSEWKLACARTLGAILAVGLRQESTQNDNRKTDSKVIGSFAKNIFPKIICSSTLSQTVAQNHRYDWIALSGACSNGTADVSNQVVCGVNSDILKSLKSKQNSQFSLNGRGKCVSAMALSYIILHGGPNVGAAFHNTSHPNVTPMDIINQLCEPSNEISINGSLQGETGQLQVGMSHLQLPESRAKQKDEANSVIQGAYSILTYLMPAYESVSSSTSCASLVKFANQVLPPLSEWDKVKLCVSFPLLAAVLESERDIWKSLDDETIGCLVSMIPYLAEFSISSDNDPLSRSAAASSVFSIITKCEHGSIMNERCIRAVQNLLTGVVMPVLIESTNDLRHKIVNAHSPMTSGYSTEKERIEFSSVEGILNFMGLLGSTAACKGGFYSQFSDRIALFLVEIACTGASKFPFSDTSVVQFVPPDENGQTHPMSDLPSQSYIIPASAFGSILSVENRGPFWRQRIIHKTLPIVLTALQAQAKTQNPPALGTLTVVCHMLCALPLSLIGESNIRNLVPTLIAGLVYFSKNFNIHLQSVASAKTIEVLALILAALVKILTTELDLIKNFIGIIIPSLLLLCGCEGSESFVPTYLFVFQCLHLVTVDPSRKLLLREKDQVIAILSEVLDHPSAVVRQAAVEVRNTWYTVV